MSADAVKSKAFQRAALKSESYRVLGILSLLAAVIIFVIARGVLTESYLLTAIQGGVLLLVAAHEAHLLLTIKGALHGEREVAGEKWVLNVLLESQIPTIALFILLASGWFTPYQVLVAPAVLLYFLLIILSTLRLNPTLALLTGVLSALGYLFIVFYVGATYPNPELSLAMYYSYAGAILAAGILAALVAGEIRIHVSAALREAQLQGELERINRDLEIARSIQQGLMPANSLKLENFDIAGWNQPADQTGGDYFDWQTLPDGRVAISLADATGHGIGPALVSALCRAYARASFLSNGGGDKVLDRLNTLLASDLSDNRFVTFAVMFLDPEKSDVKVLSAGHGPILWYQRDKDQMENLEAQGIPLGMISGISYEDSGARTLGQGDMLVLVTDGFYEWENPKGEDFGLERLEKTIREARDCSATEIIEKLRAAVESFCEGTEQKDDLTAVVLKRK